MIRWLTIWLICCSAMAQNINITNVQQAAGFSGTDTLLAVTNNHIAKITTASFYAFGQSNNYIGTVTGIVAAANGSVFSNSTVRGALSISSGSSINIDQQTMSGAGGPGFGGIKIVDGNLGGAAAIEHGIFYGDGSGITNGPSTNGITILGSGANTLTDMQTGVSPRVGLAATFNGPNAALWWGQAAGTGTNVFGGPIEFLGGIDYIGSPYWDNIAKSVFGDMGFFWGFGPVNSSISKAWPSGGGNLGVGASVQPGLQIVNANPWSGISWLGVRGAFTNASYGTLAGADKDGHNIYLEQFGLQVGTIGDAYFPLGTFKSRESQQSPSHLLLMGDNANRVNFFISANGGRVGDSISGAQVPLLVIDTVTSGLAHPLFRIPFQVNDVWMPITNNPSGTPVVNTAWKDALKVDEFTGLNTAIAIDSKQLIHIGTGLAFGNTVGLQVITNAFFCSEDSSWSFDAISADGGSVFGRIAFVKKNNQYPGLFAASTSPLRLGHSSASDFLTTAVTAQTLTDDIIIQSSSLTEFNCTSNWFGGTLHGAQIAADVLTNRASAGSRMQITDANKKMIDAAASGAVPIDADGTATTGAQLSGFITNHLCGKSYALVPQATTAFWAPLGNLVTNVQTSDVDMQSRQAIGTGFKVVGVYFKASQAAGAGQTYTLTVMTNGVATALAPQIAGASATTASQFTSIPITEAAGDSIGIRIVTSATATTNTRFDWDVLFVNQ